MYREVGDTSTQWLSRTVGRGGYHQDGRKDQLSTHRNRSIGSQKVHSARMSSSEISIERMHRFRLRVDDILIYQRAEHDEYSYDADLPCSQRLEQGTRLFIRHRPHSLLNLCCSDIGRRDLPTLQIKDEGAGAKLRISRSNRTYTLGTVRLTLCNTQIIKHTLRSVIVPTMLAIHL